MRVTQKLTALLAVSMVVACSSSSVGDSSPTEESPVASADESGTLSGPTSDGSKSTTGESPGPGQGSMSGDRPSSAHAVLLNIDARLLDGSRRNLTDYVGQPVALWMWAPW